MLQSQRIQIITENLQRTGSLSVQNLVAILEVSRETVRRDLKIMEDNGDVERVRGGIVLNRDALEPAYQTRSVSHLEEKRSIAKMAIELVADGDMIYVDNGTTLLEFARELRRKSGLTIFTNSLLVAFELSQQHQQVYMTGGLLRAGEMSLSGALADQTLSNVFFDSAFVGAGGISLVHGITDYHMEEVVLRRAVLNRAKKKVVLADSSKNDFIAFTKVVPLSQIDILVSDSKFPEKDVSLLEKQGVQVIY